MSDERWLTKDERKPECDCKLTVHPAIAAHVQGCAIDGGPSRDELLDHAEAADELIAELAACIDYWWSKHDCMGPDDCYCGGYDGPMMTARRRVDALTKDTA